MSDFKAKMHQNGFRLWLRPRPRCGSLQRSPGSLAGIKGHTSKKGRLQGWEVYRREGTERDEKAGEGKGVDGTPVCTFKFSLESPGVRVTNTVSEICARLRIWSRGRGGVRKCPGRENNVLHADGDTGSSQCEEVSCRAHLTHIYYYCYFYCHDYYTHCNEECRHTICTCKKYSDAMLFIDHRGI